MLLIYMPLWVAAGMWDTKPKRLRLIVGVRFRGRSLSASLRFARFRRSPDLLTRFARVAHIGKQSAAIE